MDQKITRLRQEIEQLDEKIQREESRELILQARHRKKENEIRFQERKQRTHRLISIGAEVESVLGRQIRRFVCSMTFLPRWSRKACASIWRSMTTVVLTV